ncbi:MAG: hypothetical protein Kow00121_62900 [Elainellaceae cyanobacterium]
MDIADERFTVILDQMAEAFIALDPSCCLSYVNRTTAQLLGKSREALIGRSLWSEFPADFSSQLYCQCYRVLEQRSPAAFEEFYPGLNGWFAVRLFPTDTGLAAYLLDITAQRLQAAPPQPAATLSQEHSFLKAVLDHMQAGIVACDASGIITLFNPAAEQILGLTRSHIIGRAYNDPSWLITTIEGEPFPEAQLPFRQVMATGRPAYGVEHAINRPDGTRTLLSIDASPLFDADGQIVSVVTTLTDITERKQAEKAQHESEERYRSVIEAAAEGIVLQYADGSIFTCNASAERILGLTAEQMMGRTSFDPRWQAICEDGSVFPGEQHPAIVTLQTGVAQSNVIMGIRKPDASLTWISINTRPLFSVQSSQPYAVVASFFDVTEQKQAEEERAQLIQEQAARTVAEAAQERSAFLAEVSAVLASSLEYERTLQSIANLVVPNFADWCSVDLLNPDQTISRVAVAHQDPEKVRLGWQLAEQYPRHLHDGYGISKVMQMGKSEMVPEILEQQLADAISDPDYLRILRDLGLKSYIIAPLEARGRVFGSISFVFAESDRRYSMADLALAEDLARRAAIAIDNARLYRKTQRAKAAAERSASRTARLQQVTAALSESLTPAQVAAVIVEQGMAALNADFALVALLNAEKTELEIIQMTGNQEYLTTWRNFSIDAPVPLAEAVRTQQPIWAESTESRIARYPHLAQEYSTQADLRGWISLPLIIEGRSVGGLSFSFAEVPNLSEEDQAFILALAQQSAQAIDRACLYVSEQKARAEAEAANHVKDQFLAIVSHELRTPLNSILGWSQILRARKLDEATATRALETIERNARSQNQLIDDLLDVSRVLRGKLKLNLLPTNLIEVIEAAIESIRLTAIAKKIQLETNLETEVGPISGDAERLQQIIYNLLSNAIKFTPEGGRVEIRLERFGTQAQLQVKDTGIGIDQKFLPHLFEYFRQADGSTTRSHGGLGLGLAIVRNLVELHGGTVQAESLGPGQGATFTVRLPLIIDLQTQSNLSNHTGQDGSLLMPYSSLDGLQILVVDDEADVRELLMFVLKQAGAAVLVASSAQEAFQMLKRYAPDLLISDIGMPDLDGYALIRQVRSLAPEPLRALPAIALTAYAGEEYRKRVMAAGFQVYLSKPIDVDHLIQIIMELIANKSEFH